MEYKYFIVILVLSIISFSYFSLGASIDQIYAEDIDFGYIENSDEQLTRKEYETNNIHADLSKVHFYLHTNDNPSEADELLIGNEESLKNSHFKPNGSLWLLVHGFGADIHGWFPNGTGIDLLNLDPNGNVILLDWSELANNPDYVRAVKNGYAVSNHTAKFLQFLLEKNVLLPEKIHSIGFSLGGQVSGIIGKRFQWLTNKTFGRITSLDPAWPLFDIAEDDDRISPDDASFVDVIHTNGGTLGMVQPRGHVDFYPNGGRRQPGCGLDPVGSCAHARAAAFFKESILGSKEFKSCKCEDWDEYESGACSCNETANMGQHVNQSARGSFYLKTNKQFPYALG